MKKRLSQYDQILARPDGRRPGFAKELADDKYLALKDFPKAMIMSIKILYPDGSVTTRSWSKKVADQAAERVK